MNRSLHRLFDTLSDRKETPYSGTSGILGKYDDQYSTLEPSPLTTTDMADQVESWCMLVHSKVREGINYILFLLIQLRLMN